MLILTVNNLPSEILSDIFLHLPYENRTFDLQGTPWTLGQVCRKWRQVALNTSRLWSTIAFDSVSLGLGNECLYDTSADVLVDRYSAILNTVFERAGPNTTLRVTIVIEPPDEDYGLEILDGVLQPLVNLLLGQCERWRSALISTSGDNIAIDPPTGKSFPALEHIDLTWTDAPFIVPEDVDVDITDPPSARDSRVALIRALISGAPRLRSMAFNALERASEPLAWILPNDRPIAPITHLGAVQWRLTDTRTVLKYLSAHLESLAIHYLTRANSPSHFDEPDDDFDDDSDYIHDWAIARPAPSPESHISLNVLRKLQFSRFSSEEIELFEKLDMPNLEELEFHATAPGNLGYWRVDLADIAGAVRRCGTKGGVSKRLRSLSLAGVFLLDVAGVALVLQVLPTVTHLELKGPITSYLIKKLCTSDPPLVQSLVQLGLDHSDTFISLSTPFEDIESLLSHRACTHEGKQHGSDFKCLRSLNLGVIRTSANVQGISAVHQYWRSTLARSGFAINVQAFMFSDNSFLEHKSPEEKATYILGEYLNEQIRQPPEVLETFLVSNDEIMEELFLSLEKFSSNRKCYSRLSRHISSVLKINVSGQRNEARIRFRDRVKRLVAGQSK
ncbi:hypothetical protein V5O48_016287 [Marasmius crinis-equi]|uniref:F-box domain-containing protein n=1 Tax=Marasmius crinis-equi TaxID=585013 RepID=A0ABR3ES78_9AGAR